MGKNKQNTPVMTTATLDYWSYLTKSVLVLLITLIRMPVILLVIIYEELIVFVVNVAIAINDETTYWWGFCVNYIVRFDDN